MIAAIIWLVFTLTLSGWWLIFGLKQIDLISHLQNAEGSLILRQHRMLVLEGSVLLGLLLGGGVALAYYIIVETRRASQIQRFFAAFTHDLKTSLASLRLQGEALSEDLKDSEHRGLLRRLIKDQVRLELQLENSLFISNTENSKLYLEKISLAEALSSLAQTWGEMKISTEGNAQVEVDTRAFESVFKNLFQNSFIHGRATQIQISITALEAERVKISVRDNGRGFQGEIKKLGQVFYRHNSTSGSGIGLYLTSLLVRQMGGEVKFIAQPSEGFVTEIYLRGQIQ
jgi:signal transduction histidine kinase